MRDTTISRIMDYALATDFAVRAGWRARSGVTSSGTPSGALWAVRTAPGHLRPSCTIALTAAYPRIASVPGRCC